MGSKSQKTTQRLEKILPVAFWSLCTLLLMVIATAVAAILISEEGAGASITSESIQLWLLEQGIPMLLIIGLSFLIYRFFALAIPNLVERYLQIKGKGRHS